MTGADSPVIADSSTVAMPSTTSPSLGITSPAVDDALVADLELAARDLLDACRRRVAGARRSPSASCAASPPAPCRAPRPSLRRSSRTSTVNQRNAATRPANTFSSVVESPRSRKNRIVVSTLPTSTTNMTGLRACVRGLSLRTLSTSAPRTIAGSNRDRLGSGCRSRALLPTGRMIGVHHLRLLQATAARRWDRAPSAGKNVRPGDDQRRRR